MARSNAEIKERGSRNIVGYVVQHDGGPSRGKCDSQGLQTNANEYDKDGIEPREHRWKSHSGVGNEDVPSREKGEIAFSGFDREGEAV